MLFLTTLTRLFSCSFWIFYNKKTCLNVYGEKTVHSSAMGDVSLEREFGISHVLIG